MAKVSMESTMLQRYNGQLLSVGSPFEADTETDAADLEALRMAKRKTPKPTPAPSTYVSREMKSTGSEDQPAQSSVVVTETPASAGVASPNGQYSRRDVRARR